MFWEHLEKGGLSLDRLKSFCRVAEFESFSLAAQGDSNRQSLYSRQVKELETAFETELFVRRGRTVRLTESGRELYSLLCEYFNALEDYFERCADGMGEYIIGAGDSIIQWSLLPKLKELKSIYGRTDITFKNLRSAQIIDSVERGDVDFGIVRAGALTPLLDSEDAGSLSFALFYPSEQKSSARENISDLMSRLKFVGMEGAGSYQKQVEQIVAQRKVLMRFDVRCSSFPMMAKAVRILKHAAILPKIAEEELPASDYEQFDLQDFDSFQRKLVVCWNARLAKIEAGRAEKGRRLAGLLI